LTSLHDLLPVLNEEAHFLLPSAEGASGIRYVGKQGMRVARPNQGKVTKYKYQMRDREETSDQSFL
tara:strand:+ start:385 stop:582 length:198 start_codon:yes stop_codon:yes gene_type:complete